MFVNPIGRTHAETVQTAKIGIRTPKLSEFLAWEAEVVRSNVKALWILAWDDAKIRLNGHEERSNVEPLRIFCFQLESALFERAFERAYLIWSFLDFQASIPLRNTLYTSHQKWLCSPF